MATVEVQPESVDSADTIVGDTRFHVSLCVADLARSVRFYECLLGRAPAMWHGSYARFELEKPALVLVLYGSPRPAGGALSHVGLRVGTSAELVEMQQRLETAGIGTQSQEGVECCYSRQTKFWASDPDGVLWELYVLEGDLDHSGFEDGPQEKAKPCCEASWTHRLTEPLPERIPHNDGSLDEVRLEGTFNVPLTDAARKSLLAEALRVLRTNGRVVLHGLVGDKPFDGEPRLPGLASMVRFVPAERDLQEWLLQAGFQAAYYETLSDVNCLTLDGVDLRHALVQGIRPSSSAGQANRHVVYRGPLAKVRDDQGAWYVRGQRAAVTAEIWDRLKNGPAAAQFVCLTPDDPAASLTVLSGCCQG